MDNNTIMLIVGFIGSMIPIFTVIVKLNSTITKLNLTIQVLNKQMENSQKDRTEIHTQLNNHETRISILESERKWERMEKVKKISKYVLNILTIINALLLGINAVEGISIPYCAQITGVIVAVTGVISTYLLGQKAMKKEE